MRAQLTQDAAGKPWRQVAGPLRAKLPKLAALLEEAEVDVLACTNFPREHWDKISSTNPIARIKGKIKRRANSSASSPTKTPSSALSAPSTWRRTTNGLFSAPDTRHGNLSLPGALTERHPARRGRLTNPAGRRSAATKLLHHAWGNDLTPLPP